ncbi:MAG: type II CAAX endopeptidase family protein [Gemmatimonadales bacterium]
MIQPPLSRTLAIIWTFAFFGLGMIFTTIVAIVAHGVGVGGLGSEIVGELVGFGLATYVIGVRVLKLDLVSLRYLPWRQGRVGFATGLGAGIVLAALAMTLALPLGADWGRTAGSLGGWAGATFGTTAVLLPAAFAEEFVFRGVGMVALAGAFGRWPAIVAIAVVFGVAHLGNDHVTALAVVNVTLAGVFLGAMFYLPGGIWTATGAHLGWNATLAGLGAPVSGLPFAIPLIRYQSTGPAWVAGAAFGPEGGIVASLVLAAAIVFLARRSIRGSTV